ncbi:hypothetical protein [Thermostichus vulcanus]|uniref:Uncharacterized protein n=1 Tax=Thermostichus vulcanus str. 'Rupite' TaxID=2813851 RepID=A0ABT0C737_THEVL|nr:hypothetical protein [Thermostichus vulcanus]MCJ2541580.1 hypothetical protein [Thermostichus vulcanus str. 'Rupite']
MQLVHLRPGILKGLWLSIGHQSFATAGGLLVFGIRLGRIGFWRFGGKYRGEHHQHPSCQNEQGQAADYPIYPGLCLKFHVGFALLLGWRDPSHPTGQVTGQGWPQQLLIGAVE